MLFSYTDENTPPLNFMDSSSILIVEGSSINREQIATICSSFSSTVDEAEDSIGALRLFKAKQHALVIVDSDVKPLEGFDLVVQIRRSQPRVRCILMTEVFDKRLRAASVQWPFLDVIVKPLVISDLQSVIRVALGQERGATHALGSIAMSNRMDECLALIGGSDSIGAVRRELGEIIHAKEPILLTGPVGIGKPYIANLIHTYGPYGKSPFVECRCDTMSAIDLSELLIGPKGRWGALLEQARNSTLVLHYVEALPMDVQSLLADEFKKISKSIHVICLAYTSLDEELANGTIDDRLYFEISLCELKIPPLADRLEDIEAIIQYIVLNHERYDVPYQYSEEEVDQLVQECRNLPLTRNVDELLEHVRSHASGAVPV